MAKKIFVYFGVTVVVFALLLVLVPAAYSVNAAESNQTTLTVSSQGPIELSKIVVEIRETEYFKGYDNDTVDWMESLGDKSVFLSKNGFVIMNNLEADKIPSLYISNVSINEIFSCNILENHSLGNVRYPEKVLFVDNVEYISEEVRSL